MLHEVVDITAWLYGRVPFFLHAINSISKNDSKMRIYEDPHGPEMILLMLAMDLDI